MPLHLEKPASLRLKKAQYLTNKAILAFGVLFAFLLLGLVQRYPDDYLRYHHRFGIYAFSFSILISNGLLLLQNYHNLHGHNTHYGQTAVCILIAGCYTPFILLTHTSHYTVWTLISIIWLLAFLSCLQHVLKRLHAEWINSITLIALGWLGLFTLGHLVGVVSVYALIWVIVGCCISMLATAFLSYENHAFCRSLWYLSLLASNLCQSYAIIHYIL